MGDDTPSSSRQSHQAAGSRQMACAGSLAGSARRAFVAPSRSWFTARSTRRVVTANSRLVVMDRRGNNYPPEGLSRRFGRQGVIQDQDAEVVVWLERQQSSWRANGVLCSAAVTGLPRYPLMRLCQGAAPKRLFDGLIWPKVGFASIAYAAMAPKRLSSPAGCAAIPREPRNPPPRHPPLTLRSHAMPRRSPSAL